MSLIGHRPVSTVGTAYCFSLFVKGQGTLLSPSFHLQHVEPMPVQVSDTPLGVDLQHISTFFSLPGRPTHVSSWKYKKDWVSAQCHNSATRKTFSASCLATVIRSLLALSLRPIASC